MNSWHAPLFRRVESVSRSNRSLQARFVVAGAILTEIAMGTVLLSACALVELSGTLTKKTGEAMTDYSKDNEGLVGKMAGFGGRINTAVGTAVEGVGKDGRSGSTETRANRAPSAVAEQSVVQIATDSGKSDSSRPAFAADRERNGGGQEGIAGPSVMSNSEAQRILTQLGFRPGPVDGTFGERTVSALISFQREKGLIPTGKLDHETIEALRAAKRSL